MADEKNGQTGETPEQKRAFMEWFRRQRDDYFWCLNNKESREKYAGRVVALCGRTVLGSGRDDLEASEDVKRNLETRGEPVPSQHENQFIVIPEVYGLEDYLLPPHSCWARSS